MFHADPQGLELSKFKSKKQNFMHFEYILCEAFSTS